MKEYKGIIFFLLRFVITYVVLSVAYGEYIHQYDSQNPPGTDGFTTLVAKQTARVSALFGYASEVHSNDHLNYAEAQEKTFDSVYLDEQYAISVEEGCNGLSIMILFAAFIIGYWGRWKSMLWFIPAGLVFIHLSNLLRLLLLGILSIQEETAAFHFFHKFGFTAIIYGAVFILWVLWVKKFSK